MLFELIKKNILSDTPYKNMDMIELMVETFKAMGKLTDVEYNELILMLHPISNDMPVVEEQPI